MLKKFLSLVSFQHQMGHIFTIPTPCSSAAIPLPGGIRTTFFKGIPSLATSAVPLPLVPVLICASYPLNESKLHSTTPVGELCRFSVSQRTALASPDEYAMSLH
jgi:hypothetical protein